MLEENLREKRKYFEELEKQTNTIENSCRDLIDETDIIQKDNDFIESAKLRLQNEINSIKSRIKSKK